MSTTNSTSDEPPEKEDGGNALVLANTDLAVAAPQQGPTLLPARIASAVSGITGVASLSVRVGTKIGGWGLYAGREGTLKTLSVTQTAVEQVLFLAGRDVASRASGELGQVEAANILEKGISYLYSGISTASFFASTGFYLSEAAINSISGLSIHSLSMLNAICGSTESSRAVAAIITLLKQELNKPEAGEVVNYWDIIVGVVGFMMLQRWGRRKTQIDFRNAGGEETIWDTVVDDKGFRADVVGTRRSETITIQSKLGNHPISITSPGEEDFQVFEDGPAYDDHQLESGVDHESRLSDEDIAQRIISQLPKGATAIVTSETLTAKTIKVEIFNAETAHIEAPPGTVMVSERLNHTALTGQESIPSQTVVFRTELKRSSSTEVDRRDTLKLTPVHDATTDAENEDVVMMRDSPKRQMSRSDDFPPADGAGSDSGSERTVQDSISTSAKPHGPLANQKKSRRPVEPTNPQSSSSESRSKIPTPKSSKIKTASPKIDKNGVIKKALKSLTPGTSESTVKDVPNMLPRKRHPTSESRPDLPPRPTKSSSKEKPPRIIYPIPNLSKGQSPITSPTLLSPTHQSASNVFAMRKKRRDSSVSRTETYSVQSVDSRPGSPTFVRTQTETRTVSGLGQTKSELGLSVKSADSRPASSGSLSHHQRSKSFVPSLYSMGSKHSGEAVILAPKRRLPRKSIYEDEKMIDLLISGGKVPGTFPDRHMVKTVRRFARFATASYGSNFLQMMGLVDAEKKLSKTTELMAIDVPHHEHSSFSSHTGLPADTIVLSSFFDPQGVTGNMEWSPSAISPLIHYISIDHDSKAVVLTCRGTLGFEDVLTDMACDFDDMIWQGRRYKVHKGIHASARRLLGGGSSRVMSAIKKNLEDHPDYGLVLCGHSLGGAVAALVAILISEELQEEPNHKFVTSSMPKLLASSVDVSRSAVQPIQLPKGRPIHVYAYGTPATMSEPLRVATRGLITTIVNHSDIVPCLSLGTLHDFRTIALHLKHDSSDALKEVRARVWRRVAAAFSLSANPEPNGPPPPENHAGDGIGEDTWAWAALKTLRAAMVHDKLVPPGEIFVVETTRVFDRLGPDVRKEAVFGPEDTQDDRTEKLYRALGRPATRVQLKLIRDVETRFGELRFGRDMFGDHSPGRYEASLAALEKGICED